MCIRDRCGIGGYRVVAAVEIIAVAHPVADRVILFAAPQCKDVYKRQPLKRVTVAVGIGKMEIVDSFTENDEGVLIKNEYCLSLIHILLPLPSATMRIRSFPPMLSA